MVERLMRGDPPEAAVAHPHYRVVLDARDRATLDTIRDRATTVDEFLLHLADIADGAIS